MMPTTEQPMMPTTDDLRSQDAAENRLALIYQPRISSETRQVTGVEALLQWHQLRDRRILPPPSDADQLWMWKLRHVTTAAHLLSQTSSRSTDFYVALDLLATQLQSEEWASQLLQTIDAANIPGHRIELILRDRECALNTSMVEWAFDFVRSSGIILTLDDFPRGASLALLTQVKFDKVKLDKSILPAMTDDFSTWQKRKDLLRGMIVSIEGIGVDVVLGGIDTQMHFNFFHDLPVAEWQGNYCGKASEFSTALMIAPKLCFPTPVPPCSDEE